MMMMKINKLAVAVSGLLMSGAALAADYSVGITNAGTKVDGGGTALSVYETKDDGTIKLIQTYVFPQPGLYGTPAIVLTLAMNPQHTFVYVAYTSYNSSPNLVGFEITPQGLVYKWEQEMQTGDADLQGSSLTAGDDYVIENKYPDMPNILYQTIVRQDGKTLAGDAGDAGNYMISGRIDSKLKLYYSCRAATVLTKPTWVNVYDVEKSPFNGYTFSAPIATSYDPNYVQSVCGS
jgi:hypothetical protein